MLPGHMAAARRVHGAGRANHATSCGNAHGAKTIVTSPVGHSSHVVQRETAIVQAKAIQEKSRRIVRNVWVALFRGINVGGRNLLPMAHLKVLLGQLGASDVKTYIQSGNVVFRHADAEPDALALRITHAVKKSCGFAPHVLLLTRKQLQQAVAGNPFIQATAEPARLHVLFLATVPARPDLAALHQAKAASESFRLSGRCCYLHTPDGLASSKLAERAERLLGVAATARNWRTVNRLLELAQVEA